MWFGGRGWRGAVVGGGGVLYQCVLLHPSAQTDSVYDDEVMLNVLRCQLTY